MPAIISVLGMGGRVPDTRVSNDDMAKIVETSDEWITQRTGIRERRLCNGEPLLVSALAASREALAESGVAPQDLGFILCATVSADTPLPSISCALQAELGATCPAMDVNAACSGFLFALYTAVKFFEGKPILVLGAEKLSNVTDYTDRTTCVLFGDGAAAAVIGERPESGLLAIEIKTYPDEAHALNMTRKTPEGPAYIRMDGQGVYKFATRALGEGVQRVLEQAKLTLADVDWLVPHQANLRIIEKAVARLGFPMEKVFINIDRYGNTSAASVPIALWELWRSGRLKRGDIVALTAFGGGLSSGAALLRW